MPSYTFLTTQSMLPSSSLWVLRCSLLMDSLYQQCTYFLLSGECPGHPGSVFPGVDSSIFLWQWHSAIIEGPLLNSWVPNYIIWILAFELSTVFPHTAGPVNNLKLGLGPPTGILISVVVVKGTRCKSARVILLVVSPSNAFCSSAHNFWHFRRGWHIQRYFVKLEVSYGVRWKFLMWSALPVLHLELLQQRALALIKY